MLEHLVGHARVDADPEAVVHDAVGVRELADDPDLVGDTEIVEITGDRDARLAQLEAAVAQRAR